MKAKDTHGLHFTGRESVALYRNPPWQGIDRVVDEGRNLVVHRELQKRGEWGKVKRVITAGLSIALALPESDGASLFVYHNKKGDDGLSWMRFYGHHAYAYHLARVWAISLHSGTPSMTAPGGEMN